MQNDETQTKNYDINSIDDISNNFTFYLKKINLLYIIHNYDLKYYENIVKFVMSLVVLLKKEQSLRHKTVHKFFFLLLLKVVN